MQISVVIATYNRARLLPELLDQWRKVNERTKYEFELIFSDDGSSDGTVELLKSCRDLPVMVLENAHGGAAKARNHAVKVASGELILFTGDDIFPDVDFINKHYEYYLSHGPKCATLGRIEWRDGIEMTYLMKHITEIGCEQFGFAALPAYEAVDFRHFYTSNVSVAKSELDRLGRIFDLTFDKYGFEDIELGYRLWKNNVNLFYTPDIVAYHDHVYNSVKQFSIRQYTAGEELVVFKKIHPELSADEIKVDLDRFREEYVAYINRNRFDFLGRLGMLGIRTSKPIVHFLEHFIKKHDLLKAKLLCSKLYALIFRVYFYAGLAFGFDSGNRKNIKKQFRFAFRYIYFGYLQVFLSGDRNFSELMSQRIETAGKKKIEGSLKVPWEGIRSVRLDPSNFECKISNLHISAKLKNGQTCPLKIAWTNGKGGSDFSRCGDPILIFKPAVGDLDRLDVRFEIKYLHGRRILKFVRKGFHLTGKYLRKFSSVFGKSTMRASTPAVSRVSEIADESMAGQNVWLQLRCEDGSLIKKYREVCTGLFPSVMVSMKPCIYREYRAFVYAPQNAQTAMDEMQFLNAMFALACNTYDFVLVTDSLTPYPKIRALSLADALIYPAGYRSLELFARGSSKAVGRFIRIKGYRNCIEELDASQCFSDMQITDDGVMTRGGASDAQPLVLDLQNPVPKERPLVFVFPVFMAVGGVERNTVEVMRRLSEQYDFVIITFERHSVNQGTLFHQTYGFCKAFYEFAETSAFPQYLKNLKNLKQVYNPDALWVPNADPWYFDSLPAIRGIFNDLPMIAQDVYDETVGWIAYYDRPGAGTYDRYIAINSKIRRKFMEKFGIEEKKIDLIYPAIDVSRLASVNTPSYQREEALKKYGLDPGKRYFACIGRTTEQKQPLKFVELADRMMREYSNIEFILVGNGDLSDQVEREINRCNLQNKLHRIKFIEFIYDFTKAMDGLVITSIYEGLPIVSIEAMCVGTPIFSTDVGDLRQFVEKFDLGCISKSYEIEDIVDGFRNFLENYSRYKENCVKAMDENISFFSSDRAALLTGESIEMGMRKYGRPKDVGEDPRQTTPLISVVIPCYNHERFILQAVNSVLNQTYENLELIVIDDGSKDRCAEILSKIEDPRYTFIAQENRGANNTINRGLALAKGKYLAILNSDDVFYADRLRRCVVYLEDHLDISMVSTYIEIIDERGRGKGFKEAWKNMEPWMLPDRAHSYVVTSDFSRNLIAANFIATTSNMVFTRELYEQIGGMRNLRYAHDWDFALRAVEKSKCALLEKPLLQYRVHSNNTISKGRKHMLFEVCWIYAAHLPKLSSSVIFWGNDRSLELEQFLNSMNLQGNDKIVWALMMYFQYLKQQGVPEPELQILNDAAMRESFMKYIVE